jgi:hypothetical protein
MKLSGKVFIRIMTGLKTLHNKGFYRRTVFAFFFLAAIVYAAKPSISDDFVIPRITTGAKIFRALLAADVDIAKKTERNGKLRLCLLYIDNIRSAESAAKTLRNRDDSRIRKMDVSIEILPFADCVENKTERFVGVFLTQTLNDEKLKILIEYTNAQKMVVFSPFEGDVERGVQSGIALEARVRPYLNTKALRTANVRLKSFFLRVAKQYEE